MKLAEALAIRADLVQKVQQIKTRLYDCVKVQEGDEPSETAEQVINDLDAALAQLKKIIYRINMTNSATVTTDGDNLTSLLARRDVLKMKVKALKEGLDRLTAQENRYGRNEIKYVRTVDVNHYRHLYDTVAGELRKLDLTIQELGWTTELI
ncbi:MAG: DIP1984 family protein [Bacteroides sp.]|nr:DIP1984 family protein [Bacteroides sp.]